MEDILAEVMRSLPPGFRFHATDEELLILYLKPKILGQSDELFYSIIPEIDACKHEPWELPDIVGHMFNSKELFLYCRVKCKYLNSKRSNRTTAAGYWKVTCKERCIMSESTNEQIGIKKTLVFYEGRMPNGRRTNWIMHEYHLNFKCLGESHNEGEMLPYVACRIKKKKDKKQMMGQATRNSPKGYSSSPYTSNSNLVDLPMNQEGDARSFCNTPSNEADDNKGAANGQPQTLPKEMMNSPPPLEILGDYVSEYINTPTYQPQAGAEDFSYDNYWNQFNYGYVPSPCSNSANHSGWAEAICEDFSTTTYDNGGFWKERA